MSVASKNAFALLDDETPEAPAPAAKAAAASDGPKPNQKKPSGPTRGGRYYQRGGPRPQAAGTATGEDAPSTGEKKYEGRERSARGRGGRGGRGGGRGRGGFDRPDRHSATGITDTDKKIHQGWGGDRGDTELNNETTGFADAKADTAADGWAIPLAGDGAATEGAADGDAKSPADGEGKPRRRIEEEEDDGTITLEEYRKKNTAVEVPKLELRQVETSGDFFKDAVKLQKDTEGDAYFAGKQQGKSSNKSRTQKAEKQFIEIEGHFERPSRGRGRGGDRGAPRGGDRGAPRGGDRGAPRSGRGRGDYKRGGRDQQTQLDVDDTSAFPAL